MSRVSSCVGLRNFPLLTSNMEIVPQLIHRLTSPSFGLKLPPVECICPSNTFSHFGHLYGNPRSFDIKEINTYGKTRAKPGARRYVFALKSYSIFPGACS
jgi:hypothetical protein